MLPKSNRISRSLFRKVFRSGRVFSAETVTLRTGHLPVTGEQETDRKSTFSFVVSKKSAKTAVRRNMIKRRGYAAVRSVLEHIPHGVWGVFFVKKEALMDPQRFEKDICVVLSRAGLLRSDRNKNLSKISSRSKGAQNTSENCASRGGESIFVDER